MNLTERYSKKLDDERKNDDINLNGVLLQLEVTNACNHKCVFCPNVDSRRKKKMIDLDLAKRVMEECADFLGKDKRICFHMNGEPLLYRNLTELVRYSKRLGYDYSFVTTNGSVATEELLVDLFEAGLDSIKFSINGGSRETYQQIHGCDDFDNVIKSLKFTWNYRNTQKKNYKIFVSCVGIKKNAHELQEFEREIGKFCDEVVFYYPCNYAGQRNECVDELWYDLDSLGINSFEIKHNIPCAVLWNSINITCEGYLSLCCSESDNRLIVEDVNIQGVKEAWLGRRMNAIRNKHVKGNIEDTPCFSCIKKEQYIRENMNRDLFQLSLKEHEGR